MSVVNTIVGSVLGLAGVGALAAAAVTVPPPAPLSLRTSVEPIALRALPGVVAATTPPKAGAPTTTSATAAKADAGTGAAEPSAAGTPKADPGPAKPDAGSPKTDSTPAKPDAGAPAKPDAGVAPIANRPDPRPIAPPPPPAGEGTLTLKASDTADIYVDGKKVGSSPLAGYKVRAGTHKVRFDCYDAAGNAVAGQVQVVTVAADDEQQVAYTCPDAQ